MLRPFIVKVSVLGYFPLYIYNILVNYNIKLQIVCYIIFYNTSSSVLPTVNICVIDII